MVTQYETTHNSELIRRLWHVIIGEFFGAPPAETELLCGDQGQMAPVIVRREAIFIRPAVNEPDTHRAGEGRSVTDKQNARLFLMLVYEQEPVLQFTPT